MSGLSELSFTFSVHGWADAVACAHRCAQFAREQGFCERGAWELGIAASELAVNISHHARRGRITATFVDHPHPGIELVAEDYGPGIEDLEFSKTDGHSRGRRLDPATPRHERGGLGTGLGAVMRLMDETDIASRPGEGTRIRAFKRRRAEVRGVGTLPTLVVGLGNSVLSDDGVGIHVVRRVAASARPSDEIRVVEAEVAGFALIDILEGYERAIIVDAVRLDDAKPGEARIIDVTRFAPSLHLVSGHEIDLPTALELGRRAGREVPRDVTVVGVQIEDDRTFAARCTPQVERSIGPAARIVLALARSGAGVCARGSRARRTT